MAYTSKYKVATNNNTWQTFLTNGANMIGYKRGPVNDKLLVKIKKGTLIIGDITGKGIVYIATATEDLHMSNKGIFGDVYPLIAGIKIHWITSPENAIQYDELEIPEGHQKNFTYGGGRTFNQLSWLKKAIRLLKARHDASLIDIVPAFEPTPPVVEVPIATENQTRSETLRITALYLRIGKALNRRVSLPVNDRNELLAKNYITQEEFNDLEPWDPSLPEVDIVYYSMNGGISELIEIEHTTTVLSGLARMSRVANDPDNGNIQCFVVAPEKRRQKFEKEISSFPGFECGFISFQASDNIVKMDVNRFTNPRQAFDPDNIRRHSNMIIIFTELSEAEAHEIIRKAYNP